MNYAAPYPLRSSAGYRASSNVDDLTLTDDQSTSLSEILSAASRGHRHLLTGSAGSGKTTLMQRLASVLMRTRRAEVVLTAPTHKAVSVLAKKIRQAGVNADCCTIHSLLGLMPEHYGDRLVFERKKGVPPVTADVVVVDECSMIAEDLFRHIRRHLPNSFVLFVGDPAQLPPVGEEASQTFGIKSRSHLDTIVRQQAGNPILDAADIIRKSQGGALDMSWCKSAKSPPYGVFIPANADTWMRKAFRSSEFEQDPDSFRFLCWTNERVAQINNKVREWIYGGQTETPFMPGESVLVRAPIFAPDGKSIIFSTNEEVSVDEIASTSFEFRIPDRRDIDGWTANIPAWRMHLSRDDGISATVFMPRGMKEYNAALARVADEAADNRGRWQDHHAFRESMAQLQAIYAMTVHTSQGSTFRNVFVDVANIRRRATSNLLEAQQLLYVAVTRPSHALFLVNV